MRTVYIAGNGRSGATLLGMMLGSGEQCFGAGGITAMSREEILKGHSSCGIEA